MTEVSASLLIAWKDLRQRVRDRSAIMLAIVVPLGLAAIFSLIFGPAATPSAFAYALVDEDRSAISRSFGTEVLGSMEDQGIATVKEMDEDAARAAVRKGDLDAAFVLPVGFADRVQSQEPAQVDVVGSVDSATATDVARSVASSYVQGLDAVRVAVAAVAHESGGLTPAQLQQVAEQTLAGAAPVTLEDTSAAAHVLDTKTYFAAGMAVFFLLFTVQFGVSSLIEERSEGTLSRLLAAPVRRTAILVGKLLTSGRTRHRQPHGPGGRHLDPAGCVMGEPGRRGDADPRRRARRHGDHLGGGLAREDVGAGGELAGGRRREPGTARRCVLPDPAVRLVHGDGQPGHAACVVHPRSRQPRRRAAAP